MLNSDITTNSNYITFYSLCLTKEEVKELILRVIKKLENSRKDK